MVAGAGPAGATAARTLALAGVPVKLIDRFAFPRNKPCGGGISFRSPDRLASGDRIVVTFYLPEHGGDITSRAKVVHSHPDPERPEQHIVACMFERMAITDRERIIRFLFFRQRELAGRKKVMR